MPNGSDPARSRRALGVVLIVIGSGMALVGLLSAGIGDMSSEGFANRHLPSALRGILAVALGVGLAWAGIVLQRRR